MGKVTHWLWMATPTLDLTMIDCWHKSIGDWWWYSFVHNRLEEQVCKLDWDVLVDLWIGCNFGQCKVKRTISKMPIYLHQAQEHLINDKKRQEQVIYVNHPLISWSNEVWSYGKFNLSSSPASPKPPSVLHNYKIFYTTKPKLTLQAYFYLAAERWQTIIQVSLAKWVSFSITQT